MRLAGAAVLGLSLLAGAPCFAQAGTAEGEVRKVDRDAGKITLRHGPVSGELEMPGMSMVFQVKDAGLLERLKPGDKVDVVIAKDQGVFYILSAEPRR